MFWIFWLLIGLTVGCLILAVIQSGRNASFGAVMGSFGLAMALLATAIVVAPTP